MSKIFKITLVLFIILFSICSFSLATDIDLNITDDNISSTENTITNSFTNTNRESTFSNNNSQSTTISSVKDTSTTSSDGLGLTNILNILLIVVGVVLILLSIAILIRLHG